ncbi:hypothetical protein L3073_14695 [Ancylomarina sp. DW003]|nr:M56 family metallopeptidase [Ancylomarina sp. DW003]MDE5423464.1 hypothetical protein [Ancylomarina sp. DW003]
MVVEFLEFLIKSGSILAISVLVYVLVLSNDVFFKLNRLWLIGSLILPWIIPLLTMPVWIKELLFTSGETAVQFSTSILNYAMGQAPVTISSQNSFSWEMLGLALYSFVSFIFLIRLMWGYRSIIQLKRQSNHKIYKGLSLAVFSDVNASPFSFFRTIYIPKEMEKRGDKDLILEHERKHCVELHSIDLALAECLLIFQWWNPFAWWARKLIAQNHEFCVDNAVIKQIEQPKDYQYLLVNLLSNQKQNQLVNNFNKSLTKKRIIMMNISNTKNITGWLKGLIVVPFLALILMAFTNPDLSSENKTKDKAKETIANDMDFRNFIARSIKYPLEAQKNGMQADITVHFSVNKKGKSSSITMGPAQGNKVFIIDEVVVTALKKGSIKQEINSRNIILEKEVARLLKKLPSISDQRMLGKTIQMKVKFRLQ